MANQLEQVLKKTKAVYKQAAEELAKKLADFQARYAEQDKLKRAAVAAGEITQEEYQKWLAGQVFQGKIWQAKAKEAAETLVRADKEAAAIVNDGCMTTYAAAMNYGTYALEKATGLSTGFTLYNRETVSRLLAKDPQLLPLWKIDQPKDYVWNDKKVQNALLEGIIQGKKIPDIQQDFIGKLLTKDLPEKVQKQMENRMRTFARTGMTGAHNAGRIDALHRAEEKGIKVLKKWMATNDERTRDSHADLDGQIREIDEPFTTTNRDGTTAEINYPGDPTADAEQVYNCRCTMVYIYPEIEDTPEDTEPAPEYEQMTFDQWVEAKENQEKIQGETDTEKVTMEDAREPEPEIIAEAAELEQTEPEPEIVPEEELEQIAEEQQEQKKDPEDYTVDEIMEKVDRMEQAGEYDDEKKNLLPMADEETRTGAHETYMSIPEAEREKLGEKTTVKIADLYTEQAEVFTPRLEDLAESFDGKKISGAATEDHPTGITVAKYDGKLIVLDGNNRTNLAMLKGQDEIDVMLVDLDAQRKQQPEPRTVTSGDRTVCREVKYGELFTEEQAEVTERTLRELDAEDALARPLDSVEDVRVSRGLEQATDHLELYEEHPELVPCNAQYLSPGHNAPEESKPRIEIHNETLSTQPLAAEFDERHALREKYGDGKMDGATAFDYAASSLEGTIRHEYAHALADSYGFFGNPGRDASDVHREAREWFLDFWRTHQRELTQISKYAASHPDEMIAECYVQVADTKHKGTIAYKTAIEVIEKLRGFIEAAKKVKR